MTTREEQSVTAATIAEKIAREHYRAAWPHTVEGPIPYWRCAADRCASLMESATDERRHVAEVTEAAVRAEVDAERWNYDHGTLEGDELLARLMDTLAYYHCRSVNPKADHPRMGYHAMSEDQREFLRERQREAAEEIARMWAAGLTRPATVTPSREALIQAISVAESLADDEGAWALPEDVADAILALLPGRSEAVVKAEALREAALNFGENQMIREGDVKEWFRSRADLIERGEG